MKLIVVPVDFSGATRSVVDAAVELAGASRARLVILHVRQPPAVVADYGPPIGGFLMPVGRPGAGASREIGRWRRYVEARHVGVETAEVDGASPSRVIAAEAERRGADCIVMGSHGHTALYDLLVGGTASGVLKGAPCPVVIVPARRKAMRSKVSREAAHA